MSFVSMTSGNIFDMPSNFCQDYLTNGRVLKLLCEKSKELSHIGNMSPIYSILNLFLFGSSFSFLHMLGIILCILHGF